MNLKHYIKYPGAALTLFRHIYIKLRVNVDKKMLLWAIKSPRNASFYYYFQSKSFDREHYSVLYGKLLNINNDSDSIALISTLRRSIHMIEKGLTTVPLKPVFAEGYIQNTIETLKQLLSKRCDNITQKWAYDVLARYFQTVQHTPVIKEAFTAFNRLAKAYPAPNFEDTIFSPYTSTNRVKSSITYEEFLKLCQQRHSVRWYEDREVPIELVKKAIAAGLTAPSACNRQPFRFIIINEKDKLSRTVRLPMGTDTFAHNIKLMVILIGDLSGYFDERDRHLIYIDASLAAMNFMLALETLGLSSCPINWPDIEEREQMISTEFNLEPNEKGIMFFSIGYPLNTGGIPYSAKKQVDQVTTIF
jgi:nitroreductase